jgi:hypothetical protein
MTATVAKEQEIRLLSAKDLAFPYNRAESLTPAAMLLKNEHVDRRNIY